MCDHRESHCHCLNVETWECKFPGTQSAYEFFKNKEEYPAKEKDEVTILKEGTLPLTQNCLPVAMATPKPTRSTILHERMEK